MDAVYRQLFRIRTYEIDPLGCLNPLVLLNFLQEAAGGHATRLGVAVGDLNRLGLTWVLSRLHVQFTLPAPANRRISVETWPSTREGRFSCREFIVSGEEGDTFARATTSWAAIDLVTRRPRILDEVLPAYPLDPRRAIDDTFPAIPRPSDSADRHTFTALRSNLDLNNHVNNVVYAAWLLDGIPDDTYGRCRLGELELDFRSEVFAGEGVVVLTECQEAAGGADAYLQQILAERDGRELLRARTVMVPRVGISP